MATTWYTIRKRDEDGIESWGLFRSGLENGANRAPTHEVDRFPMQDEAQAEADHLNEAADRYFMAALTGVSAVAARADAVVSRAKAIAIHAAEAS